MAVITSNGRGTTVVVNRDRTTAVLRQSTDAIAVRDARQVQTLVREADVVAIATPGVQGPRGAPGGTSEARVADGPISGHRIVRSLDAARVGYASNADASHGDDTLGMTLNGAADGAAVDVQRSGPVLFAGWSWIPGAPVYLGADGFPTQTEPTEADATFCQAIGYAEAADTLFLAIAPAVYF